MIDIEPIRERFSAVAPFLDERGRRLVAAAEAFAAVMADCGGRDGDRGCAEHHRTGPEGIGVGRALGAH